MIKKTTNSNSSSQKRVAKQPAKLAFAFIFAMLLALTMAIGFAGFVNHAQANNTEDTISFIDAGGILQTINADDVDILTVAGNHTLDSGWYLLRGQVTGAGMLTISGTVHLIIEDGANWTITGGGVRVTATNSVHFYAQSTDENTMGRLHATGSNSAAIGSASAIGSNSSGTVVINGGHITAVGGGNNSAGIGTGGRTGTTGTEAIAGPITINGGIVTATGVAPFGAGIGGGGRGHASFITINGGVVTATGTRDGAGIGGGGIQNALGGNAGVITIGGGFVTATAGLGSTSIGAGRNNDDGTIIGGGSFVLNGNATVIAIRGINIEQTFTRGLLFVGVAASAQGTVYGEVTLQDDLTITAGQTLTIPSGTSIAVANGGSFITSAESSLINDGTITPEAGSTVTIAEDTRTGNLINGSPVGGTGTAADSVITQTAITLPDTRTVAANTGQVLEFARNTTNTAPTTGWQADRAFIELLPDTQYFFFARAAENANFASGEAVSLGEATTARNNVIDLGESSTTLANGTTGTGWSYNNGVFTITGNVEITGTGINNRRLIINGGTTAFYANLTVTDDRTGVSVNNNAVLNMTGGSINSASGVALLLWDSSVANISAGTVISSTNAAISVAGSSSLTIGSSAVISRSGNGSAIFSQSSGGVVVYGTIELTALGVGTAINNHLSGTVTINTGAVISANTEHNIINNTGSGSVIINGGLIENLGTGNAINNIGTGNITLSGSPIINGNIRTLLGSINASDLASGISEFDVYFTNLDTADAGDVAIVGGAAHLARFNLVGQTTTNFVLAAGTGTNAGDLVHTVTATATAANETQLRQAIEDAGTTPVIITLTESFDITENVLIDIIGANITLITDNPNGVTLTRVGVGGGVFHFDFGTIAEGTRTLNLGLLNNPAASNITLVNSATEGGRSAIRVLNGGIFNMFGGRILDSTNPNGAIATWAPTHNAELPRFVNIYGGEIITSPIASARIVAGNVSGGSTISIRGPVILGGIISGNATTIEPSGIVTVPYGNTLQVGVVAATLTNNGTIVGNGTIRIQATHTLINNGTITSSGVIENNGTITNNGMIIISCDNIVGEGEITGTGTVNLTHLFTVQTRSDATRRSEATYTAAATYYYSCEHCGEIAPQGSGYWFEYGNPLTPVISIQTQPVATSNFTFGAVSGNLSVAATVSSGATAQFLWQRQDGANWIDIGGANSATFTIPSNLAAGTHNFRVRITATGAEAVYSSEAEVVVGLIAPTEYTITFDTNNGTMPSDAPTHFEYGVGLATLPTPTRTGYTFGGWFDNAALTGTAITSIAATHSGTVTLWARWTADAVEPHPNQALAQTAINNLITAIAGSDAVAIEAALTTMNTALEADGVVIADLTFGSHTNAATLRTAATARVEYLNDTGGGGLSGGAIAGIVLGSLAVLLGGGFAVYWFVLRPKAKGGKGKTA